jgi:hypothetical protein
VVRGAAKAEDRVRPLHHPVRVARTATRPSALNVTDGRSDGATEPPDSILGGDRADSARHPEVSNSRVPPWDVRRDRRALVLLFLVVWSVYLGTATYTAYQVNDNRAVAVSAWSLATRGTLALPAEWAGIVTWEVEGIDGNLYTDRFPGAVLMAAIGYVVADAFGWAEQPSHPLFLNFAPPGVTAATVAALAVAVLFAVFRRLADRRTALLAAMLFAFGTASWSVSADSMWTHGPTSLSLALGTLALASDRLTAAGSSFAFAILARPQTAVVPAVVGLWGGIERRHLRPVLSIGIPSAFGLLTVSMYTHRLFGTWLPVAGYDPAKVDAVVTSSAYSFALGVMWTLIHPNRGVLLYTPVLVVLLPFVHRGWRIAPGWVRSSAIAGVVYLAVQLRSNVWHGGYNFFGSRLTIETLVLISPLLLCIWQAAIVRRRLLRWAFIVAAVLSLVVHTLGATVLTIGPSGVGQFEELVLQVCDPEDEPVPIECDDLDLPRSDTDPKSG